MMMIAPTRATTPRLCLRPSDGDGGCEDGDDRHESRGDFDNGHSDLPVMLVASLMVKLTAMDTLWRSW